jgi:hypothetical protein
MPQAIPTAPTLGDSLQRRAAQECTDKVSHRAVFSPPGFSRNFMVFWLQPNTIKRNQLLFK